MARPRSPRNDFPTISTVSALHLLASPRVVRRGLVYARAGRVTALSAIDGRLEARVEGTRSEPYLVRLEHDGEEYLSSCTCPFDWEPFCKHAIAALAVHFGLHRGAAATVPPDTEMESAEVEVRRDRGRAGGFRIRRRQGDGYFGIYEVTSPSGASYQTEIRSLTDRCNRCSCPDHASSDLGTCKHIEAVLATLAKRGGRKFEAAQRRPPAVAQVFVDFRDRPRVRLHLPPHPTPAMMRFARDFFDAEGNLRGDPSARLPELRARSRRIPGLILYGDVEQLADGLAAEREAERRREEVAQRVLASGTRIPGVRARLYPYQVAGAAFLAAAGRALLADDMGLGKTVQAIAAARVLLDRGELRRALIVCPASLRSQWAAEVRRFAELECQIVGGSVPERLGQYARRATFTITNYELVVRDGDAIRELAPDLLILDEAQRIRNWRTKTAEAIKFVSSRFAFVLTGTPLQNRLDDLYSVMQVVDRRVMGPLWAYNESFVVREDGGNRISGYRNLDELRRRLRPHLLRRTKEEVRLQLPERINSRIGVEITPAQRQFMEEALMAAARYAALSERRPLTPEEEKRLFMAMQKARMSCNAAGLIDKKTAGSPKLDEFEELIRDLCLERGRKVVVFSEWERFGRMAAQRAERLGIGFVRLHGSVPAAKRGGLIERFRDDPDCLLFFSTDAGGVGLNLQFASTVINLDLPWNPAVLEQRIGRLHRLGQSEPVHVLLLVAEDSFESGLEMTLRTKRALFDAAMDRRSASAEVAAPSSCLATVREALFELRSEVEAGEEPVLVEEPGAAEKPVAAPARAEAPGAAAGATPAPVVAGSAERPSPEDVAQKAAELLGPRVRRVVAMPTGQLVALVDRVDDAVRDAAGRAGLVAIEARVEAMLDPLGSSPFQGARTIFDRADAAGAGGGLASGAGSGSGSGEDDGANEVLRAQRDGRLAVARRKLTAARTLAGASLGAEAIEQSFACMTEALRALALRAGDPATGGDAPSPAQADGQAPARLLYEVLVPRGLLTLEQAALVSRAEGLSRAYAGAAQPVGAELVQAVLGDAERLVEQAAASQSAYGAVWP